MKKIMCKALLVSMGDISCVSLIIFPVCPPLQIMWVLLNKKLTNYNVEPTNIFVNVFRNQFVIISM